MVGSQQRGWRREHVAAWLAVVLAAAVPVGCGGDTARSGSGGTGANAGGGSGGGTGGGIGGAGSGGRRSAVPLPDANAPSAAGAPSTLVIDRIYLGDTDRDGNPSSSAWKDFGLNLDGLISTQASGDHCSPVAGANLLNVKTDGVGGIDNSFGSNLLPLFLSLDAWIADAANEAIRTGSYSILLELYPISPEYGSQNDIVVSLFEVGLVLDDPRWDGSDVWPVFVDSVLATDQSKARDVFPNSYLVNGTWVSGRLPGRVVMQIPWMTGFIPLQIEHAFMLGKAVIRSGALSLQEGIIAGLLPTEPWIESLREVARLLDPSLCEASTFDSIAQQMRMASDMLSDGTQDPARTCDAISIGLGFSAVPAQRGSVVAAPTWPSVCR